MKSTCEPLEGNKVKLSVEVDEAEFDRDIDAAFRKLATQVRLPGFRPGKAPRKVLEARIGLEPARQQALQDSIPQYLAKAVREHSVDLIDTPDVELVSGAEGGTVAFDATCEVRPEITVPGYGGLRVELPSLEVAPDEIDTAMDAERRRHASLVPVERPAARGDHVTLDLVASRDGEPLAGLQVEDWEYEVGQGWIAENFDDEIVGASAGDELSFTAVPKGTEDPADFAVKVTAVSELTLPELTDEWVADHLGEHDTVEAWRSAVIERIRDGRLGQVRNVVMDRVQTALADLVDIEAPAAMVDHNLQQRVQGFVRQIGAQGISIEQWLSFTGQQPDQFMADMRERSEVAVKVDLALRAVATAEGLEVDDDDVDAEINRIAIQVGQKPAQVRKAYERNDALEELRSELRKAQAMDWLLHRVEMVDPEGHEMDRDLVLGHSHDDHDHAHDHDHDGHDQDGTEEDEE